MAESSGRFLDLLQAVATTAKMRLNQQELTLLLRHYDLLMQWNRRMNLTSLVTPEEIAVKHFGESLWVARAIGNESGSVVDVGSGAGFPGFPVAVTRSGLHVLLVESIGKKVAFLKEVTRHVTNVRVHHGRFEDLERRFDWAIWRGVAFARLAPVLSRKARRFAVLTSERQARELPQTPEIHWEEPEWLPWGRQSVLILGATVPRENRQR